VLEDRTLLSGFVDGFEGPTLNSFWTQHTQSGSITFPSTAQVHGGSQSVQLNSSATSQDKDIHLQHDFLEPTYGRFSVWVYDTGANAGSGNYIGFYLSNSVQSAYIQGYDYNFGGGRTYETGTNQGEIDSGVVRTEAWHEFEINATAVATTFKVDGVLAATRPGMSVDQVRLMMSGPSWRPAFTSYFDDFEFDDGTAASHFNVSAPASATAGAPFGITVSALDANGSTATGYNGTVHFTTSDSGSGVVLPADYTFTTADQGVHTFTGVTLVTAGSQTVTATDTGTSTITGIATVMVNQIAPTSLTWNTDQGGVDYSYRVSGGSVPQDTTVALYWSSSNNFSGQLSEIPGTDYTILAGTPAQEIPYTQQVGGGLLKNAPAGTQYLLVVIGDPTSPSFDASRDVRSLHDVVLHYKHGVPQVLSDYTISVIKDSLRYAGQAVGQVTSTIRTPAEQAGAMYHNIVQHGLASQRSLYSGNVGAQAVLDAYEAAFDAYQAAVQIDPNTPRPDYVQIMTDAINEQMQQGHRVSRHVVSMEEYATYQVVDLSFRRTTNPLLFDEALNNNPNIDVVLDPYTTPSDPAFHLEISQP
jgi:hypothetical protein